jgi:hypothetical protein
MTLQNYKKYLNYTNISAKKRYLIENGDENVEGFGFLPGIDMLGEIGAEGTQGILALVARQGFEIV